MKFFLVPSCFVIFTLFFTINPVFGDRSVPERCVPDDESDNDKECVISKNEFALLGKTIKIPCMVSSRIGLSSKWFKNGQPIKFSFRITKENQDQLLIINEVNFEDNGVYTCLTYYPDTMYSVNLEVQSLPYFNYEPQNVTVVEGRAALLKCNASGVPKPEIEWLRNGKELSDQNYEISDSGDMQIQEVQLENYGEYTCRATNAYSSVEATVFLVMGQPIKMTDLPKNSELNVGDTARFRCDATIEDNYYTTKRRIDWLRNNEPIDFATEPRIFLNSDSTLLTIIKISKIDAGTYTCVASTDIDTVKAQANLVVHGVPKAPILLGINCGAKDARILWNATNDNYWPITHYSIEYNTTFAPYTWQVAVDNIPAIDQSYNIQLSPSVNYTFRVIAWNKIGPSQPSSHSIVCTTPPDVPYNNPKHVRSVTYLGYREILVGWTEMQPMEHNGPNFMYRMYYKRDIPGENWTIEEINSWTKNYSSIYTELDPDHYHTYKIKVAAVNAIGECKEPPQEIFGFFGNDIPLEAPGNFTVDTVISGTTAILTWTKLSDKALRGKFKGYEIECWIEKDGNQTTRQSHFIEDDETSILFNKLTPHSKNYLRIAVHNEGKTGPYSEVISFDTPDHETTAVEDLYMNSVNSTTMLLKWNKPFYVKGGLTGYLIILEMVNDLNMESILQIEDPEATSTWFSNLTPQTKYRIFIRAITTAGEGHPSSMEKITPAPRRPNKPKFTMRKTHTGVKNLEIVRDVKHNDNPESYYFIEYHKKGELMRNKIALEKGKNEVVTPVLEKGHDYIMYMIAVDEGYFTESDPQEIKYKKWD